MSKKDLLETAAKSKQVNVLLWFVVIVIIGIVCFFLYKGYKIESTVEDVLEGGIKKVDNVLTASSVSQTQIEAIRETIKNEYVTFSDMDTRVIDTLSQDGMLWGKNYLIQSAISCVEIGFDLNAMQIYQDSSDGRLIINLGKAKLLNQIPNGKTKPLVVRFEGYIKSEGSWSADEKMKLQDMVNEKMLRNCAEWNYYQKAGEKAFQQIELLIKHKLKNIGLEDIKYEIIIEQ